MDQQQWIESGKEVALDSVKESLFSYFSYILYDILKDVEKIISDEFKTNQIILSIRPDICVEKETSNKSDVGTVSFVFNVCINESKLVDLSESKRKSLNRIREKYEEYNKYIDIDIFKEDKWNYFKELK